MDATSSMPSPNGRRYPPTPPVGSGPSPSRTLVYPPLRGEGSQDGGKPRCCYLHARRNSWQAPGGRIRYGASFPPSSGLGGALDFFFATYLHRGTEANAARRAGTVTCWPLFV